MKLDFLFRQFEKFLIVLFISFFLAGCAEEIQAPYDLTVGEGFINPIGFYDSVPNFSWKLPVSEKVNFQYAYRIVAASDSSLLPDNPDLWDSEKVVSDSSVWVKWKGDKLKSREKVFWQVKFWNENGDASAWSKTASFELGLLSNKDWQNAKWINLSVSDNLNDRFVPQYFRKDFLLEDSAEDARLYITAKGLFEAYINGKRVGNTSMTPGWTPYKKRIETITYDVTHYLKKGENTIGVVLGEGWYWGRIGYTNKRIRIDGEPGILCRLETELADGQNKIVASDSKWKGTGKGPIRFSGIYDGEIYDANFEMSGWNKPGFDADNWEPVRTLPIDEEVQLQPKRHHPVRAQEVLSASTVSEPEPGKFVFDLGQNMVGIPELKIPVKKGAKVTVRFAEMLNEDGTLYTENYRTAQSTDYYISANTGEINWRPSFTFHGFRYVELSGFDSDYKPRKSWVSGIVQHSDFNKNGTLHTSDTMLNRLQKNIVWGLKGNFLDIPTDCPQRDERMGWTGDAQVFAPTSLFNADVYSFWASWLQSMREEQADNGALPVIIPSNRTYKPSVGWADAATVIPWTIYQHTGDKNILRENYEMMLKLIRFYMADSKREKTAFSSFGDWLQPFSHQINDTRRGDTSVELIHLAYFIRSVEITANTARILGQQEDDHELSELCDSLKLVFQNKYLDANGKLTTEYETQTAYLMALGFGLVPDSLVNTVVENLVGTIERANKHLQTGFLGTPLLAPVLDEFGQTELVYELLFQETYPSWFYSINQGATTMWERWNSYSKEDGFGDASMNSFNHYAYGAIGEWMYKRIGGISALEPGYKKILIAPLPDNRLHFAEATYVSVYGLIRSKWKNDNDRFKLEVTIPPNSTAEIRIPAEEEQRLIEKGNLISEQQTEMQFSRNDGTIILQVLPGNYVFEVLK